VEVSRLEGADTEDARGFLRFAASRAYMNAFKDSLAAEAGDAGGSVRSFQSEVEDLTRQITDTAARLEAKRALRERLLLLLERAPDDIENLLAVERQLAEVQSDIESTESYLRALRGRVSMDRMSISYEAEWEPMTPGKAKPLQEALQGFIGVAASSLAQVITGVAVALPWLLVGLPALFILLLAVKRGLRRG
jgi:chromosome segregation ATPase